MPIFGISLPGTGEAPVAPVFVDGVPPRCAGPALADELVMIDDYVNRRFVSLVRPS
jgi:(E)-4-hydroxy-3-methylbut-2-enyl-diphosphate synthase